jgi:AAA+ ATPase superfamily predicted ATPase
MDYANFHDRMDELKFLKKTINSRKFQFIPVWGRRRVGKTSLILKALEGKGIYFLAAEITNLDNIKRFQEDAARDLKDPKVMDLTPDWEIIFKHISEKNPVIVIDEFPYLIASNNAIPTIFQRIIDLYLMKSNSKLILCGSSIRMMESQVLEYKAPLYGRRTGQIHLKELPFKHLNLFFPGYKTEDIIRIYGACGGIPMYLQEFDPAVLFWNNIEKNLLNTRKILYSEADFLLKQEFTNPATYKSILGELAYGKTKMNEIRTSLGFGKSDISPYLNNLYNVGIVKRFVSITESEGKSRKGIYKIVDNYLNFYFRYILPNKSLIESGNIKNVLEYIKQSYDTYLGHIFEQVVTEAFLQWSRSSKLLWDRIGKWWFMGDEIDLVALSSSRNEILFCEIKWSKKPVGKKIVEDLLKRAKTVRWGPNDRKETYMVVSRNGFTQNCKNLIISEDIIHWTLSDIEKIFWSSNKSISK